MISSWKPVVRAVALLCNNLGLTQVEPTLLAQSVSPCSHADSLSDNSRCAFTFGSKHVRGRSQPAAVQVGCDHRYGFGSIWSSAYWSQGQLTRANGAEIKEVVSGKNAQFSFSPVSPGHFQVSVSAPGFAAQIFSGKFSPGQTFLFPAIKLPIERADTEVRVQEPTVEVAQIQIEEEEQQRALGFIPNFYVIYVPDAATC